MSMESEYSRRRAAEKLCVSEQMIDRLIRAGLIQCYHIGRRVVIPATALLEYVARCQSTNLSAREPMKEKTE